MNLYVWTAKTMKDVDCAKNMVNAPKIFSVAMIAKNINQKPNTSTPALKSRGFFIIKIFLRNLRKGVDSVVYMCYTVYTE